MTAKSKPAVGAYPITPNDSTVFTPPYRSLMIAVAGDIRVRTPVGGVQTLTVPAGVFPCEVDQVHSTGTTATGITGFV